MRKIFNELPPTPEPEKCAKEKEALGIARDALEEKNNQLLIDKTLVANNLAIIKSRENEKNPIEDSRNKEQSNYQSLLSIRNFFQNEAGTGNKTENGVPSAECFTPSGGPGRYRNSARCLALIANLDINESELKASKAKLESYDLQINKIYEKINTLKNEGTILETNVTKTSKDIATQAGLVDLLEEIYNACVEKSNFSKSFNLKSNPSCKEIKQKIKIVNQKRISIDRKSLDLNYGVNSLDILNINKKLSDKIIEISQELILKLDKIKPPIINIDPLFSDIYKKAKDDLSSYQTEGKILEAKLKKLKIKEKTIPVKKNNLKTKFHKLIKQLKNCLK